MIFIVIRQCGAHEEVQDHRGGSSASQTYGVSRWQCVGGHHEGPARVLDHQAGVRRAWNQHIVQDWQVIMIELIFFFYF